MIKRKPQKIKYSNLCFDNMEYFKQFNLYETIECKDYYINRNVLIGNRYYRVREPLKICNIEATTPNLIIHDTKLINTMEGTSLEGQHLSGKKLIVNGEVNFKLVVSYYSFYGKIKYAIKNIKIPFTTFIIVPKDVCNVRIDNLRYLVEDVSIANLGKNKVVVSVTPIIQYIDEYISKKVC